MKTSALLPLIRIVDDDPKVLASEAFLVTMAGFQTITYENAQSFLENYDNVRPGCVLLDIRMPGMSGLQLQDEMLKREIDLPIIFLTGHGDIDMAVKALQTGATDFLVKPPAPDRLKISLQKAVDKNIEDRKRREEKEHHLELFKKLTPSEQSVVLKIAHGEMNKVIAFNLGVSEQAVKNWRSSIFQKLDCKNAIELNSFLRVVDMWKD